MNDHDPNASKAATINGHVEQDKSADRPLNITIAGAGIGGLAAAIGLRKQGHSVTVLEQAREIRGVGYGIHLAPNGVGLLRRLGVDIEGGKLVPMNAIRFYKQTGVMFEMEDRRLTAGKWQNQWFLGSRIWLHEELLRLATADEADGSPPVQIRKFCQLVDVDSDSACATLADGSEIRADVIIGADGVHSRARDAIVHTKPYPSRYNCFRMMLNREDVFADSSTHKPSNDTMDMIYSPKTKSVCYPILDNTKYNTVVTHLADLTLGFTGDAKGKMMELCADYDESFRKLLDKADPENFRIWPLYDMQTLPTFAKGRLALIGDAAHPFTPHLAQGGVMALEDAASLSVMLSRGISSEQIPERLHLYNKARHGRGTFVQKLSLRVGGDRVADDGDTFSTANAKGEKKEKQTLNVQKYLDEALSYDEHHASSQILREWQWKQQPYHWSQPTNFGPAPWRRSSIPGEILKTVSNVDGVNDPNITTRITFKTSGTLLKTLFPNQNYSFRKLDTVALCSIEVRSVDGAHLLPGLLYNTFTIYVHDVQYNPSDDCRPDTETPTTQPRHGTFCLATFVNVPEALIYFREELGLPALFSDIKITCSLTTVDVSISWRAHEWALFKLTDLVGEVATRPAASSELSTLSGKHPGGNGLIVSKYIPSSTTTQQSQSLGTLKESGKAHADVDIDIYYPSKQESANQTSAEGEVTMVNGQSFVADLSAVKVHIVEGCKSTLPTLHHVTERLAEIPIFEVVDARVHRRKDSWEIFDWDNGVKL